MSFTRLIYWSCIVGGWSAFCGWLVLEILIGRWVDRYTLLAILMATLVAVPIGAGVRAVSGPTQWADLSKRLAQGCVGGLIGGLLGSLLGACVFAIFQNIPVLGFLSRVVGWTLIGLGIGVTEGIFDRSAKKKIRNGLLGGGIGGFLAGLSFIPVSFVIGSPMSSRAVSFVLLGLFLGLAIGMAQVFLKEAWLTVEEGFRPGRQVILGREPITMGTSEKSSLIFIAYGAKGVEPTHLRITRTRDGSFVLEDNQSRTGTLLNGRPVAAPTLLANNDAIQFGVNMVRFRERVTHQGAAPLDKTVKPPPRPLGRPLPRTVEPVTAKSAPPAAAPVAREVSLPPQQPVEKHEPAALAAPEEGRCPICSKKVIGIPNQRRCPSCLLSF